MIYLTTSSGVLAVSRISCKASDKNIVINVLYNGFKLDRKINKIDYIIIDEASQVDLITGVLALSCAKNSFVSEEVKTACASGFS